MANLVEVLRQVRVKVTFTLVFSLQEEAVEVSSPSVQHLCYQSVAMLSPAPACEDPIEQLKQQIHSKTVMNLEQDRPFICNAPGCAQRFPTEDHLMIHRHKHEMTLKFPAIKTDNILSDQTPTPTRFLKNCEEVGLFNELACSLEQEFRKAQEEEDNKRVCVGITMALASGFATICYTCITAYSLYYLFASFQSHLPWTDCFSWWGADETCSRTPKDPLCNLTLEDGYFEIVNTTWLYVNNETCPNGSGIYVPHQGPSEQYWDKVVLRRTSSMDETGEIVWYLALYLLLARLIIGAVLSKGIKSSGKVVYFTATFPYVVLTILLIRGLTLEGAYKGIEFYIGSQSDFSKLADAEVWKDAATQIFFSIAISMGGLSTLSSYNKFHNNCYRDTITVCVVNCATSVFAGFVIFSTLGHMAHIQNKPVPEVVQSGIGLAFVAYPEALAQLPWAPFWSILFFFMLLTLGFSSQFGDF
ncbi:hypothetical protein scyTo_0011488, partial [Scyliorhinus torazame]|nr:hypothetical protein [Scyliorhinus torazame]